MGTSKNYSFWSKMKKHVSSSVVLIFFTILALICANTPCIKDWYFALWQNPVSLSLGEFNFFSQRIRDICRTWMYPSEQEPT